MGEGVKSRPAAERLCSISPANLTDLSLYSVDLYAVDGVCCQLVPCDLEICQKILRSYGR